MKIRVEQIICTVMLALSVTSVSAQQDPHFAQYFDNTLFVNPAYAGSKEVLNVTAIHREQWTGFNGRPRSTTLSLHTPLPYESIGVGLTAVNDNIGPMNQTMVYADFSYTLKFKNSKSRLAFGVKGGVNIINASLTELNTTSPDDQKLSQNISNKVNPNFGFGVYYHLPNFFVGASIPKMLESSYYELSNTNLERRHYYGIIGGVFDIAPKWKIRPSVQTKMTMGAPVSFDLSTAFIYNDLFWIGGLYRWNAAAGVFVQVNVTRQFKIGLATEFGVKSIRQYNTGTFEMLLSYDLRFKNKGVRSPRYF